MFRHLADACHGIQKYYPYYEKKVLHTYYIVRYYTIARADYSNVQHNKADDVV